MSVGTVPGSAPGGRRSSSVLMSAEEKKGGGRVSGLAECRESGGIGYLQKGSSSYQVRLAWDLRLPRRLVTAIAVSVQTRQIGIGKWRERRAYGAQLKL